MGQRTLRVVLDDGVDIGREHSVKEAIKALRGVESVSLDQGPTNEEGMTWDDLSGKVEDMTVVEDHKPVKVKCSSCDANMGTVKLLKAGSEFDDQGGEIEDGDHYLLAE